MRDRFLLTTVLILLFLIPVVSLFHPGLPITHDGSDHVARIANFYKNLQEGIWIPRWGGNLNWGYGHAVIEFLYPLPSYLASLCHFLGASFVDSFKIVLGLGLFASGLTMYLWLATFLPINASIIGAMLYVYAPYRFVNVYVRGDIGENLAFIFIPLVLYFLQRFFKTKNVLYGIGIAVSWASLILAHNAISLMFLPFILFYLLYLGIYLRQRQTNSNSRYLLYAIGYLLLGFGLAGFFWIPALLEGKFTLRNIVTAGVYAKRFVSFPQFLFGKWNYGQSGEFTLQFGLMHWFVLGGAIYYFLKTKISEKAQNIFIAALLLYTAIAMFLMLPISDILYRHIMLLQNFQFPWRFLAIPVFTLAVLGGYFISRLPVKNSRFTLILFLLTILFIHREYWFAKGYEYEPESYYTGIFNSTTDTGESSPIWSVRFMEERSKAHIEFIEGSGTIQEKKRTTTKHEYTVISTTSAQLLENTVYFPGWKVSVNDKPIPIEFQNRLHHGLITFPVEKGTHNIVVFYTETKLRLAGIIISIVSAFGLLMYSLYEKFNIFKNNK